jgi:hypothetical protein
MTMNVSHSGQAVAEQRKAAKSAYDRDRRIRLKAERDANRPPDPIVTLTAEERAYLAGLIDADGSIYVAAVGPLRHRSVYPIVTVAMTHLGVIEWMATRLEAGTVKNHNHTSMRRHPNLKQQYRTQVFGKRARLLCEVLLPYLRVKNEQARLVATFPVEARIAAGVKIAHSEINLIRYRLRDEINALNH